QVGKFAVLRVLCRIFVSIPARASGFLLKTRAGKERPAIARPDGSRTKLYNFGPPQPLGVQLSGLSRDFAAAGLATIS
ncbi:hypothetical protein NW857_10840, partial [Synechococcus sp. H55.9]|uniref:hypothetical protein n=1 Tax=Synechococcus sp. H55.9 TaxID=2964511 RepID=UPI0039C0AC2F